MSTSPPSPTTATDDEATVGDRENKGHDQSVPHRPRWCLRGTGEWNRAYLLTCGAGLITDPLFFYALSVSGPMMCLFIDGWFAASVTMLRCMVDAMHVWNMVLQLREAWGERRRGNCVEEDGEDAGGKRRRGAVPGYLKSKKGFLLDLFVVLPVMQHSLRMTIKWCKPTVDFLKSNTDAGYLLNGNVAIGGVLRDHSGHWKLGFRQGLAIMSILEAEIRSIQEIGLPTRACYYVYT